MSNERVMYITEDFLGDEAKLTVYYYYIPPLPMSQYDPGDDEELEITKVLWDDTDITHLLTEKQHDFLAELAKEDMEEAKTEAQIDAYESRLNYWDD